MKKFKKKDFVKMTDKQLYDTLVEIDDERSEVVPNIEEHFDNYGFKKDDANFMKKLKHFGKSLDMIYSGMQVLRSRGYSVKQILEGEIE